MKHKIDDTNKDYVGMVNCFFCNKPKSIIMDRRMKKSFPREAVYDKEPCPECKGFMEKGIIFIGVKDGEIQSENPFRTGEWFVIKDEAVQRMPIDSELKEGILTLRFCFIEQTVLENLGLKKLLTERKNETNK